MAYELRIENNGDITAAGVTIKFTDVVIHEGNVIKDVYRNNLFDLDDLDHVGTITIGTWDATPIAINKGGTGATTITGTGANVLSNSPTLVTPILGVASGTSFNGITGLATTTPLQNGPTDVGISTKAAREDHVHSNNNPTFTGNVTLPSTTTIGGISAAELAVLDGVTSNIQAQLNTKAPYDNVLTLDNTTPYSPSSSYEPATKQYVDVMAGSGGGNVEITKIYRHIATAGQTVFAATYILGSLNITVNGVELDTTDYTAANGTSVTISSPVMVAGDIVRITCYGGADVYNTTQTDNILLSKLDTSSVINNITSTSTTAPLSAAQGKVLQDTKAPIASPTFTGTVSGITKAMVGLGSVDNTADSAKNVLSATKLATARAINGVAFDGTADITVYDGTKAPIDSPTFTGTVTAPAITGTLTGNASSATTAGTLTGLVPTITELNFVDGVTSAIQTQLNGKAASSHTHTTANITGLDTTLSGKVDTNGVQALHTTDALRISGSTLQLFKGDGTSDSVALPSAGIGEGQTWQNVTRTSGTTYTNSTGRTICVSCSKEIAPIGGGYGIDMSINVNSILISRFKFNVDAGSNYGATCFAVVPNGATYIITGHETAYELR